MFDVNHVSSMLKNARIKKNLTQGALAEKIGVTFQAVSNWERGNSLPDLSNLANICSILDIDLYELSILVQLAPFIDGDLIEEIGKDLTPSNIGEVVELSPFVTNEMCAFWIEKLENLSDFTLDIGLLSELGPFLSQEKMDQLAEKVIPDNLIVLDAVAPFLS